VNVQVLKKEKRTRRMLAAACAVVLFMVLAAVLSLYGPAIFQRGNPIPYLAAAAKISEEQPYVQVDVDAKAAIFLSKRGGCPELFAYIESKYDLEFDEQLGSGYVFSDGTSNLVVTSEIYWGKYTVWEVPQITLQSQPDT